MKYKSFTYIGKPEWIKSVWESFKRMPKLDQEEYLKLSTDIERDMGLSVDIETFWTEIYAGQTPNSGHELSQQDLQIRATVKRMYGNESLPTLGN